MKRTVYLPDELSRSVEAFLHEHPETTLSALVQEALKQRLETPDPAAILDLAGLVTHAEGVPAAREHAEDAVTRRARGDLRERT